MCCGVGLDPILGLLLPAVGDFITMAISLFIFVQAMLIGVGCWNCTKMITYIFLDWLVGTIPALGDIFDFFFRSNMYNKNIVKAYLLHEGKKLARQKEMEQDIEQGSTTCKV
mmetsp:Transcript_27175/g.30276  ORF Transcript_27175/g.30276 Transcript_27175/m.30276 type:complete len:112 (+) Transcript_27175:44-379(+)